MPLTAALAVLCCLARTAWAAYGTNRCAGTWTHWSPGASQAIPCLVLTNGITATNVAYSKPLCTMTSDYAYKQNLDQSPIATIVSIFDWVASMPTLSANDASLSLGFTNDPPPTAIGDDTSQINWILLDRTHPTRVLDESTFPHWGKNLILKFECLTAASCYQITVHDVNCYQEKVVDRTLFQYGITAYQKMIDGPFSINCDATYGYGDTSHQMCNKNWEHSAHTFWNVQTVANAVYGVVSYHFIPGVNYGDAAGLTTNTETATVGTI